MSLSTGLFRSNKAKAALVAGVLFACLLVVFATLARAQGATDCSAYAQPSCADVPVGLPYETGFDGAGDPTDKADKDGQGTGFSMVQPSSNGGAYLPEKLDVDAGVLKATTTKGIQYKTASDGTNATSGSKGNALDNGLGVGVDAANKVVRYETTITNPPNGSGQSEQAGIWIGPDEDNYAKLVIASTNTTQYRFQLMRERGGVSVGSTTVTSDEVNTGNFTLAGKTIKLVLLADATANKVTGFYSIDGGPETQVASAALSSLTVPAGFFDGSYFDGSAALRQPIDGVTSFGGLFTTQRNRGATQNPASLVYTFDDFKVSESAPPDTTPPAAPAGLSATAGNGQVVLDWADNAEGDLKGYNVYRSTGTPVATTGTPLNGATPLTGSTFTDAAAQNGTIYNYVVRAVDNAGNASAVSANANAMPDTAQAPAAALPARINFQSEAASMPDGYAKDFGKNYANVRGFGWVEPGTANPRDLSVGGTQNLGNGRDRNDTTPPASTDQRLDTLMHVQADDLPTSFNGTRQEGAWEMALPDGRYEVEVGVGDASPGLDPTSHEVNVEGVKAIDDFATVGAGITAPTGADRFESNTVVAEVADGELTVDAQGGTNTKINYLIVREAPPVDATAPTVENVQPAENAAGVSVGTDVSATFSEDMDADSIDGASFTLAKGNGPNVPADVSYDAQARTATLDPDADLDPASSYAAAVTTGARDAAGNATASAKTWSFETASDTTAPAAPAGLAATAGEERVDLAWDAVPADDLAGYNVYRKTGAGEFAKANGGLIPGTAYADAGLNAGTEYVYAVTAVDEAGNESERSATQAATPRDVPDTEGPTAPGNVRATGGERKIDLAWDAATDTVGVAGYNVYEGQTKLNDALISGTSFAHSGLGDDEEHSYVVEAADAAGNTARAAAVTARTLAAVECPAGACADKTVALPFEAAFGGDDGIHDRDREGTGFRLVQQSSNGGKYLPEKLDVAGGQLKITATSGIQYKNATTGTNAASGSKGNALDNGLGARFDASGKTVRMAVDVINPPGGANGSQQTGLWFGPNEDNYVKLVVGSGGASSSTANQHKVQIVREINGASAATTNPATTDEINMTVPTGTPFPDWRNSTINLFLELDSSGRATAFYAVGSGAEQRLGELTVPASWYTAASEGGVFATKRNNTEAGEKIYTLDDFSIEELDRAAPAAPQSLAADAGDAKVDLSWTANSEDDLAGYNVYRDGTKLNQALLTAAAYADTNLTNGTEYAYTVSAVDDAGNESAKSAVRATPQADGPPEDTTAPAAPQNIAAAAGDGRATLTWSANTENDLAGYTVYRKAGSGEFQKVNANPLATPGYEDSGLTNGTEYAYKVTAVDDAGNESADSNSVAVTPRAAEEPPVESGTVLEFDRTIAGSVLDKDDEGTGFASVQPNAAGDEYLKGALDLQAQSGRLVATAQKGTTTAANTLKNGLRLGFDGTEPFVASTRLIGPLTNIATSPQQGAVYIGPNQDNYVKLAAIRNSDAHAIQLFREIDGSATASTRAEVGYRNFTTAEWNAINTLDLFLAADPATGVVTAEYSIDGGARQKLPTSTATPSGHPNGSSPGYTVPQASRAAFFNADSKAGIMAFTLAAAEIPVTFDRFAVEAYEPPADTTAPATPQNVAANAGDAKVDLSWTANAEADLAGYNVYRGTSASVDTNGQPLNGAPLTEPRYTDSSAQNGATYHYVVQAVDKSNNRSAASTSVSATPKAPETGTEFSAKINFQNAAAPVPSGYLRDYGQPFGARGGADQGTGLSYGWIDPSSGQPLDLSTGGTTGPGNGRDRNLNSDQRLDTLMHVQADDVIADGNPATFSGVAKEGVWEISVPDGAYEVTVAVGDSSVTDLVRDPESHAIRAEGTGAINGFVPGGEAGAATRHQTSTVVTTVNDGRLTIDAQGGTNTKINYVDIRPTDGGPVETQPYVNGTTPASGATNVSRKVDSVVATFLNASNGVDGGTFSSDTIRLVNTTTGVQVPATYGTSGGNDTISLLPRYAEIGRLDANTTYRFEVTDGVRDNAGNKFKPYSMTFTTGSQDTFNPPGVTTGDVGRAGFDEVAQPNVPSKTYTSVTMGPDEKLYAATVTGEIYRFPVASDGMLGQPEVIRTVQNNNNDCNTSTQAANGCTNQRLIMGLTFDPAATAENPVLWISHNSYGFRFVKDFNSKITRLSGPNLENYKDIVNNLPRSSKDHLANSIAFKEGKMYITVGATTAMGEYDDAWRGIERPLAAAVLEVDYKDLENRSAPVDVKTPGKMADGSDTGGTYDPYAAGAPVRVYATGVRNAVDILWHSNGSLYLPTNGSAANGAVPATPANFADLPQCKNRPDGPYSGPAISEFDSTKDGRMTITKTQDDYLFRVEKGGFYGNPNPSRCEWVLNGGNPTTAKDPGENPQYPVGTMPDRNWRGWAYDFANNKSPNGVVEYQSNNFGGKLKGKLLVARYSGGNDIVALTPNGANGDVNQQNIGVPGLTLDTVTDPLDLTEDTGNGNLYVTAGVKNPPDGTGKIVLLRARDTGESAPADIKVSTDRLIANSVKSTSAAPQSVVVSNVGVSDLRLSGASLSGTDAGQWSIAGAPSSYPLSIKAGEQQTFQVRFDPTSAGPKGATLNFASDDPDTPTARVKLRGLGTNGLGGSNEPSLQWILDTFEIPVNAGDPNPSDNSLPTDAKLGDEVTGMSKLEAAYTDAPVTIEPLAVFGPQDPDGTVTKVGRHTPGQATGGEQLFTVANASYQSLNPSFAGAAGFETAEEFGLYSEWPFFNDRRVSSEDALNTWETVAANRHKMRFYPLKDASGVVPNAFVVATEEHVSGYDYQDVVYIIRNVRAVSSAGEIEVNAKERVFSGVKGTTSAAQTVEVANRGNKPLDLSGVTLAGPNAADFSLATTPAAPTTLQAGEKATFSVRFAPRSTVTGSLEATLRIASNDADEGTTEVGLYGLSANGEQGNNEPTLSNVVKTLGHPVNVGGTGLILGTNPAPIGDEVTGGLFKKAGSGPVGITPVARYSPDQLIPFGYYTTGQGGEPNRTTVASMDVGHEQELNPPIASGGQKSFDPGAKSFGFFTQGLENRLAYSQDAQNQVISGKSTAHAVRSYPDRDRSGQAIANTFIVAFEDATNGDYQDYVFLVTNVTPSDGTEPPALKTEKFNFQPDQVDSGGRAVATGGTPVATPEGYTKDAGAAYDAARGYGWVTPAGTPEDLSLNGRLRTTPSDPVLRTMIIMQGKNSAGTVGTATNPVPVAWERNVPNGAYTVKVGVGDAAFFDGTDGVKVEDTQVVPNTQRTTGQAHLSATADVNVTDGKLTLLTTGQNTKLNFVEITGEDTAPPPPPSETKKVNFQPDAATVPDGYAKDAGLGFDAQRGYGWVAPGTNNPANLSAQTRERNLVGDQRLDTFVIMQPGVGNPGLTAGSWEHALPNGAYEVTLSVGDAGFINSVHEVNVEGVNAVDDFVPTDANKFKSATVTVNVTDGRLTVDATGGDQTKLDYVDIVPAGDATPDETDPTVGATLGGTKNEAGAYLKRATLTVEAEDNEGGSGIKSLAYSVNGGEFRAYTAPVDFTEAGEYTVVARATDNAGNEATGEEQRFTVVIPPPGRGEIEVENLDGAPFADRLVFNRIQNPEEGTTPIRDSAGNITGYLPPNTVHDVATLRVKNTGPDALSVEELRISDAAKFRLVEDLPLPAVVKPGESLDVPVRFIYSSTSTTSSLQTGTLTVVSDDSDEPETKVDLAGFWQIQSEGGKEPNFGQILATYGYGTTVPQGSTINTKGKLMAQGDEILSPYWFAADPSKPVSVRQLAAFHTQGNTASFGWTQKNTYNMTNVLTHVGVDGQSFLPRKNDTNRTPGLGTFNAPRNSSNALVPFGFRSDPEHSDHAVNTAQGRAQIDYDQGCVAPCGHHFRTWPALDRSGQPIPNTYLMTMDYAGINYDFQDNVYLVTNIKPENPAIDPAAPAPLPGAASLKLEFDKNTPNTLADKNNAGTGFKSTQPNKNDVEPGSDSYKKEFLEMAPAAPGTLAVTTSGTTNGAATNGLVNGLRLPFDGSGGEYTMSARLVGPLNNLGAGQGGVMFGSDQDNFVKVAAINRTTANTPSIEFFAERGGNNATANGNGTISTATIPNGGNVSSLDLYLTADRSTGEIRAAYRADGGALTAMPGKLTLTAAQLGRFFAEQAKAGIIAHHGTATNAPTTLTFDRFAVTPGAPDPAAQGRNALYRLDTGTAQGSTYTDAAGNAWTSDAGLYTPAAAINEGNNSDAIENTEDDALYRTYRGNVGNVAQAQRVLTYNLPTSGAEKLDLRLHFAERAHAEAGKRLFDIEVEGRKARTNFDIFNAAGGKNTATALTIDDVAVTDGSLTLALRASVDFPAISAIEVLCEGACPDPDKTAPAAPSGLAATGSETGIALDWENNRENDVAGYNVYRSATENGTFTKLNTALVSTSQYNDAAAPAGATSFYRVEAVDASGNVSGPAAASAARPQASQAAIRINTGGPAQTVGGVAWRACDAATNCSGFVTGGNRYSENDTITGIPQGMNNAIFQSEWTGGRNSGIPAGGTAFSFNVPVSTGDYRLRLHFAELNKTANGTRVFDVNVEGGTKELTGFDVFKEAGGAGKAIVREIPVRVTDDTMNIDFIAQVENAKISAIEILPTVQQDTEAPAAPQNLSATASEAGIALDWADNAETDLSGYNVSRSATENGAFAKLNGAPLAASAFNDVDVDAGKTYFYRVTAVDKGGNESGAAADSATMPDATGFTTITWTNTNQNQPQSNSEGQSEVVGGKLYSFGGFDSRKPCCSPTSRAYSYTPAAGWTRIANMPAQNGTPYGGVTHAGFTTDGEDIFWAGGYTSNGAGTGQIFGTREVFRYDVSGDRYVKLANLPAERAGGQLEYLNGKLYYFGGTNLARTQDVGNLYVLDLANQAAGWTERAAMPNGRHHLASAVIGGKVYAVGGQKAHDEALIPQADVHAYDPQSNTWTQRASMPRAINHATSSTVVMGGRIVVVGGQTTHTTGVADVNAYNPTTDAWTALTPLPTPRHSAVAGVLDGNIYFSTGGTNATLRGVPGADTTAPKVAGVQPAEDATDVGLGANVQASFNEAMDNASLTAAGNFVLAGVAENGDATPVAATVTTSGNKAILDPDADLEAGMKYTATIKGAVRDAAGNPLGADKTWSFSTEGYEPPDTTAPDAPSVRLAAGSDSGASNTDGVTNANRPTFEGTAEAGSTVEIFDGGTSLGTAPANGSGNWSFTAPAALADGDHAITARATDAADNASPASATLQLTVDTTAPDTTLAASGPSGTSNSASAEFAFSSESGAAFECRLDAGSYAACASPKSYTGLANGQHTFAVRATDRAGNTDASAAERIWTVDVDTTPPTVQNVSPQADAADVAPDTNVTATFSEGMRASSISGTTFTLKKGATTVNAAVTYDAQSRTATLDPAASLDEGVAYTATLTTGAQDAAGNALGSARTWSFTTRQPADTTPPAAPAITAPADNGYDTDGSFAVSGTAEANSTVKLLEGTTEVGRTTAGSGGNWSIQLADVAEGRHTYAATATDAANNASPKSANVTVTVDGTAPAVIDVEPSAQAADVAVGTTVEAVFSEDMKASTINNTTFKLVRASDNAPVAASVTYSAASRTATLDPNADLNPNTTYMATVTTGVQDAAGNAPANVRVWSFTTARPADTTPPTVTDVSPVAQALDVAPATDVTATFSEEMLANTISADSFTLTRAADDAKVQASVGYDAASKKATLNPDADLDAGKTYTARISTTVKDAAGNALSNTRVWSFTTRAAATTQKPVRIEAGGPGRSVNGVPWTACSSASNCGGYVTGGFAYKPTTLPNVAKPVSPASAAVYQQEWTGGQTNGIAKGAVAFSFNVPVENGGYLVRLHFAEIAQSGAGKRLFDVNVEGGANELSNFDIFKEAGGMNRAIVREFDAPVSDGTMNIQFVRQLENAKVSAIEILPTSGGEPAPDGSAPAAPAGLKATASSNSIALDWADNPEPDTAGYEVYRADAAGGPFARLNTTLAVGSQYNDATAQPGKTYYYRVAAVDQAGNKSAEAAASAQVPQQQATRVNVGGPSVTGGGLTWSSCSGTTACPISIIGGGKRTFYTGATTSPNYPAALFDTGWSGGQSTGKTAGQRAFGFDAYVPQGKYTVRLHFAEKQKTAAGQRLFHINVEERRVLSDLDVYKAAGGRNRATFRQFTVDSIGTNGRIDVDFITRKDDALLQAVEIIPVTP